MVDQRDPGPRQALEQVDEGRQREAVDHRQAAGRQRRQGRARGLDGHRVDQRKAAGQLVHPDLPPQRAQALDHAAVVDVAAGPLLERAGYHQLNLRAHSGCSRVS